MARGGLVHASGEHVVLLKCVSVESYPWTKPAQNWGIHICENIKKSYEATDFDFSTWLSQILQQLDDDAEAQPVLFVKPEESGYEAVQEGDI